MENEFFILIVEWDGDRPPTIWYDRLARYGLRTRIGERQKNGKWNKDKSRGPIERRRHNEYCRNGVVLQEGTYLLGSQSTANVLADTARAMGASMAIVARSEHTEKTLASQDDKLALQNLEASFTRGRPTKKASEFAVITCHEEMRSWIVASESITKSAHCPSCHGLAVEVMYSPMLPFDRLSSANHDFDFLVWLDDRFGSGSFRSFDAWRDGNQGFPQPELPAQPGYREAVDNGKISPATEESLKKLGASTLLRQVELMKKQGFICAVHAERLLDFGYHAIAHKSEDATARMKVIAQYLTRGGTEEGVEIFPDGDDTDVFDALASMTHSSQVTSLRLEIISAVVSWMNSTK